MIEKTLNIRFLSEDIIKINFKESDTLKDCLNKFYKIMKKHGIKKGTNIRNNEGKIVGTQINNYEWTMCEKLFMDRVNRYFEWNMLTLGNVPKNLMGEEYEKSKSNL